MNPDLSGQRLDDVQMFGGLAPDGRSIVSAVFSRRFSVNPRDGGCESLTGEWLPVAEPEYYKGIERSGRYRPSL